MTSDSLNLLQKRINKLNKLLNSESFYLKLCSYSNNNINDVIDNLSKIIFYYLYNHDSDLSNSLESLLNVINSPLEESTQYLIYPTNTFYYNQIKLAGLNNTFSFTKKTEIYLEKLASILSVYPQNIKYSLQVFFNLHQAILTSFFSPTILYQDILKQPHNQERPIIIGESETTYYQSVLKTRLSIAEPSLYEVGTNIAKKYLSKILEAKPLLVFLPTNKVSNEELTKLEISSYINSSNLLFLTLPSYYELQTICALNKGLTPGTKINFQTANPEHHQEREEKSNYNPYTFSRFEKISVNLSFNYINPEFSGDPFYDIDKIYGILDTNKSREVITHNFYENLEQIRHTFNINVKKIGSDYLIQNGRHRIIYLKHYYLKHYEYYKKINRLSYLDEKVTIPMFVEYSIDNQEYISLLDELKKITTFSLLKNEIRNNDLELLIVLPNYVYFITTSSELKTLLELIKQGNYTNKFLISYNNSEDYTNCEKLIRYIILSIKEYFFKMSFLSLLNYLKNNLSLQEQFGIDISNINIRALYYSYNSYINRYFIKTLSPTSKDIISEIEEENNYIKLGQIIIDFLNNHQEYRDKPWKELYDALHQIPELSPYSSSYLRQCADHQGYQKILLEDYYRSSKKKRNKLKKI